jgi:hypothetical protein
MDIDIDIEERYMDGDDHRVRSLCIEKLDDKVYIHVEDEGRWGAYNGASHDSNGAYIYIPFAKLKEFVDAHKV